MPTVGTRKVNGIQYVRAVAALLVVFYHETMYLSVMKGQTFLHDVFGGTPGLYGVVAFFVLSGYLMADIAPKYAPSTFIVHRVTRIYPTYLMCVLLAAVFFRWLWYVTKPAADFVPSIGNMLFAGGHFRDLLRLTLAPAVFPDFPLGIEWTLLYEISFYVIVLVVSMCRQLRFLPHLAIAWLAVILWASGAHPEWETGYTSPSLLTLPFFGINAGFIFGIIANRMRSRIHPLIAIPVGALLLISVPLWPNRFAMIETSAGLAAIVIGIIALERIRGLAELPMLKRLGDWSYAIYLAHVPVIVGTYKLLRSNSPSVLIGATTILVLAVAAIIGLVDVRGYYRLKAWFDRASVNTRRIAAGAFLVIFASAAGAAAALK